MQLKIQTSLKISVQEDSTRSPVSSTPFYPLSRSCNYSHLRTEVTPSGASFYEGGGAKPQANCEAGNVFPSGLGLSFSAAGTGLRGRRLEWQLLLLTSCVTLERQLPLGLGFLICHMRGLFYKGWSRLPCIVDPVGALKP